MTTLIVVSSVIFAVWVISSNTNALIDEAKKEIIEEIKKLNKP